MRKHVDRDAVDRGVALRRKQFQITRERAGIAGYIDKPLRQHGNDRFDCIGRHALARRIDDGGVRAYAAGCEHLRGLTGKVQTSFVLDTLQFMWKGGRCSAVSALGANLLSLKPGLEMKDGKLGVYKKYRGNIKNVYKQYVKERLQGRRVRPGHVFITESGEVDDAVLEEIFALVRETIPVQEIHHTMAGCTVSTHCGPKTLGILFIEE